ncbi:MAG: hypothetical protein IPK73_08080 [Candidatus Obscuribacter sp.]|nr:hypothetical protein [Candidatus Obscuribacter sp.]MBK9279560.1 hypothetical protein [Candidatus Obscuribacter sp.]
MTILVAVKKGGRVFLGADRMMTSGSEYAVDVVNGSKIIKLKHAYIATSGYTLLDNCIEHLYRTRHAMMENKFSNRHEVFQFFLDLFGELKKNYTLVDTGKDTFAAIYNVFLVATPTSIYSISQNLSVTEYGNFAARGAGSDFAKGCLYGIYDLVDDGLTITRMALEASCHFSIYCKEPIDIIEVKAEDFGKHSPEGPKSRVKLVTHKERRGLQGMVLVKEGSTDKARVKAGKPSTANKGKGSAAKAEKKGSISSLKKSTGKSRSK